VAVLHRVIVGVTDCTGTSAKGGPE
jgi:hypothetical protein